MATEREPIHNAELSLPASFPSGQYTPHGYIDNPHHTMIENRSGVIRSVPPLGFGFWRRCFKGAYGTGTRAHVNYLSLLNIAVAIDDVRLVSAEDFSTHGIELASHYHSKHMISYDWSHGGLAFSLKYFLPRENTLACLVEVLGNPSSPRTVHIHAMHTYGLWEARWWGADGVGMRYIPDGDVSLSTIWAHGDFFALGADRPSIAHKATADANEALRWARSNNTTSLSTAHVRGPGPLTTLQTYAIEPSADTPSRMLICLSRGVNEWRAQEELATARTSALVQLERQLDEDEAFWSSCPQLDGDWPDTWKHGWVYDWETLRMNVREPCGNLRYRWDGMQVHSPRIVLGEASVDMFTLGHATPAIAQEVMLGTFADAPAANVPCYREDGSMNMVAWDAQACGTAPIWCLPFKALRAIFAANGDVDWLKSLYPYLKAYLDWWLDNRADEHGWFHCHCDWESGQDGSRRFPEGEGADADHVATVDVEASMTEALANMAEFARITDHLEDVQRWADLAVQKATTTREMFVDGWYRDFDTRTGQPIIPTDYVDIMMLAPLACGVATPEQIEAVRPRFDWFRENPKHWLEWASFFMVYTEAAWTAGLRQLAADATADIANRVYARTDARHLLLVDESEDYAYRVPGIANEYWPLEDDTEPGGEAYGWGATLPLHIIRSIIGFRESDALDRTEFHLSPTLPAQLVVPGRRYTIRNLSFRDATFAVTCLVLDGGRLQITVDFSLLHSDYHVKITAPEDAVLVDQAPPLASPCTFECENGAVLRVAVQEKS